MQVILNCKLNSRILFCEILLSSNLIKEEKWNHQRSVADPVPIVPETGSGFGTGLEISDPDPDPTKI